MSRCGGFLVAACLLTVGLLAVASTISASSASHGWETDKVLGDAAVSLSISGPAGTHCGLVVDLAGWVPDPEVVEQVYIYEWDNGNTHSFRFSWGNDIHAHASPLIDTRSMPQQNLWATTASLTFPVHTGFTMTIVAPELAPWPDGFDDGEISMGLQLQCSRAVTAELMGAREVRFLTTRNADTGAGAWSPLANVGAGHLVQGTYTADDVRMRAGIEGPQLGLLALWGPGLVDVWPLVPDSEAQMFKADGGPGSYLMAVNRAGALDDDFWSVLMGLRPITDVEEIAGLPGF